MHIFLIPELPATMHQINLVAFQRLKSASLDFTMGKKRNT